MQKCKDCPYIKDQVNRRLMYYGYNDISNHPEWKDDIIAEICLSSSCEKLGTKIYRVNSSGCEDYVEANVKRIPRNRRKSSTKRSRHKKYQNKLKNLSDSYKGLPPVIYTDEKFVNGIGYLENPKPYYKRCYRGRSSSYHKRMSNHKIRRYKGDIPNGNWCHKLYDFWWEMY